MDELTIGTKLKDNAVSKEWVVKSLNPVTIELAGVPDVTATVTDDNFKSFTVTELAKRKLDLATYPALKKLVNKKFEPSAKPFKVTVESKGVLGKKGSYCCVDNNKILMGICLYNVNQPVEKSLYHYEPLAYVNGMGFGLVVDHCLNGSAKKGHIIPIDISSVTSFKEFNGAAGTSDSWFRNRSSNEWAEMFCDTFSNDDIEKLLELYDLDYTPLTTDTPTDEEVSNLKANISNKDLIKSWVMKNYPIAYRYGFAYKGAKATSINKSDALNKIGRVFEYEMETIDGKPTLVFQDYSECDMW